MEYKNFRSVGDDIYITSTLGHSTVISKEFSPVPSSLWREAYSSGAISEDMKVEGMSEWVEEKKKEAQIEKDKEEEEIKVKLREIKANPATFVDTSGKVSYRKAMAYVGKSLKKDVLERLWDEVVQEVEV